MIPDPHAPRPVLVLVALWAVVVLACACGDASPDRGGEGAVAAADGAVRGSVVQRAYSRPENLNPLTWQKESDFRILKYFAALPLLMEHPDDVAVMPWLADDLPEMDGDTQVWTLRAGARWDDGRPVTAADVAASWRLLTSEAVATTPGGSSLAIHIEASNVRSVEALDARRFRVTLEHNGFMPMVQFGLAFPVVPAELADDPEAVVARRSLPSCGPYRVGAWTADQVVLERKTPWWGDEDERFAGLWSVATWTHKVVEDTVQIEEQLKSGAIDLSALNSVDAYVRLGEGPFAGRFGRTHFYLPQWSFIGWNCDDPLFDDPRVRRALSHLVPRGRINAAHYHDLSKAISGPFHFASAYSDPAIEPDRFSVVRARELLAEAGWGDEDGDGRIEKDGRPFSFVMLRQSAAADWAQAILGLFGESLKQAGIEMIVEPVDGARVLFGRAGRGEYQAFVLLWALDAFPDLYPLYHSSQIDGGFNWMRFRDDETDALVEGFRRADTEDERVVLARRLHRRLADLQPTTFLFTNPSCVVWNPRLENVVTHRLGIRGWDVRVPAGR